MGELVRCEVCGKEHEAIRMGDMQMLGCPLITKQSEAFMFTPPPAEKPREWWIGQMVDDDTWVVFETKKEALQWYEAIFHEGHIQHLIELSAFERVVAERDQLDREVCYQVGQKAEALKERDQWKQLYTGKQTAFLERIAELEQASQNSISLFLHEQRIAELEKQLAEAKDTAERHIRGNLKGDHYTRKVEIERDRYRAALEKYAELKMFGDIAREALKGDE